MTLYTSTPLNAALDLTPSLVRLFFESQPFDNWKKGRESEGKTQVAIVNRLNDVIRGQGVIAKTVAKSRF